MWGNLKLSFWEFYLFMNLRLDSIRKKKQNNGKFQR